MKLKKLAAMMAAAAMVFSLAACGGKSNTVESKSVENAAEETMTVDKDKKEILMLCEVMVHILQNRPDMVLYIRVVLTEKRRFCGAWLTRRSFIRHCLTSEPKPVII